MSSLMLACIAFAGLNVALALVLGVVYWRNHREIRSPFTFGLLLFSAFLLVHNGMDVYHFVTNMPMLAQTNEVVLLAEGVLQTGALGALLGATLR